MGTNNEKLRNDPLYIGAPEPRIRGDEYDELIEEFVMAVQEVFPNALIQFEDFATANAFRLLKEYRDRVTAFNDDMQGTASVTLAGIYSALRLTKQKLTDQKILFLGAGEAGVGISDLIVAAMVDEGMPESEARRQCWLVDSKGLVESSSPDLEGNKLAYAHEHESLPDFISAVRSLKPTAIIGVSGQPNTFTGEILETVAQYNEHPIVFALSNPTSKAECTAEEAYRCTAGRAVYASGSPFDPVELDGKRFVPGQGNNAYIFPGVGLGVVASEASRVTDEMFFAAAKALADQISESDLALGSVYPPLSRIREVSKIIAAAVADVAYKRGLAANAKPDDLVSYIASHMYEPEYRSYA
jgi:malate dehydrogenase (oxaloacetate-decarboxylating)(NADP+)